MPKKIKRPKLKKENKEETENITNLPPPSKSLSTPQRLIQNSALQPTLRPPYFLILNIHPAKHLPLPPRQLIQSG